MPERFFAILLVAVLASTDALAADHCVRNVSALWVALNTASANGERDTIRIAAGRYNGTFDYNSSEPYGLEIIGGFDRDCTTMTPDSSLTTLTLTTAHHLLFDVKTMADVLLANLTFIPLTDLSISYFVRVEAGGIALTSVHFANEMVVLDDWPSTTTNYRIDRCAFDGPNSGLQMDRSAWGTAHVKKSIWSGARGVWVSGYKVHMRFEGNRFVQGVSTAIDGSNAIDSQLIVANNVFIGNVAHNLEGGGAIRAGGRATIVNNLFLNNRYIQHEDPTEYPYPHGGAGIFYFENGPGALLVANNTFVGNESDGPKGGAVAVWSYENANPIDIVNNIFWNNTVTTGATDVYVGSGQDPDAIPPALSVQSNLLDTTAAGVAVSALDNIATLNYGVVDPQFVSAAEGDYALSGSSPLIDAGISAVDGLPDVDLAGNVRIFGDAIDLGAYEYQGTVASSRDEEAGPAVGNERMRVQAYPNPANHQIRIHVSMTSDGEVALALYDVLGRNVMNLDGGFQPAGDHVVVANVSALTPGTYFVRGTTRGASAVRRVVIVR